MATRQQTQLHRAFGRLGVRLWIPFVIGALVSVGIVALLVYFTVGTQRDETVFLQREVAQRLAAQTEAFIVNCKAM